MKKLTLLLASFVILACAPAFIEPVEVEIEGTVVMEGRLTVENTTTGKTYELENAHTDRLLNEMLEALSTGEFDKVDCIAFRCVFRAILGDPVHDTIFLPVFYDGGAYDTCNWVRWRSGWRFTYGGDYCHIYYWYLLPQYSPLLQLSDAYAFEASDLFMQWSDSVAITWTYVQSAKPE